MPSNVKVSASWKTVSALYTRVGGSWKNVAEGYTKVGGAWKAFFTSVTPLTVEYLVIAGGGGGGASIYNGGGGGGAGGYRTATGLSLTVGTSYTVTVGAGGAGSAANSRGVSGANSVFGSITSAGGGGGSASNLNGSGLGTGFSGGSGGGGFETPPGQGNTPSVSPSQGNNGGIGQTDNTSAAGTGGGGGAGAVGQNGTFVSTSVARGGNGGNGVASTITGTSVTRAGGGGGNAVTNASGSAGTGGTGGGGNAVLFSNGQAGTANTGGGGGGGGGNSGNLGGAGGSGIVIIKYPSNYAINPSPGLSHRTITSAGFNITTFTAGTGTVSFAAATTSSYELIQTVYLTASQSSITFDVSGISSDYQHLQVRFTANGTVSPFRNRLRFNGDSASNYATHLLYGTGSSVLSAAGTSATEIALTSGGNTTNAFSAGVIDILDPFETTKNKTIRNLGGSIGGNTEITLSSGVWLSTGAITSVSIRPDSGSYIANSRFSIYGIKGS